MEFKTLYREFGEDRRIDTWIEDEGTYSVARQKLHRI